MEGLLYLFYLYKWLTLENIFRMILNHYAKINYFQCDSSKIFSLLSGQSKAASAIYINCLENSTLGAIKSNFALTSRVDSP